jgi:G2/mitotic-specific cyclin 1/2
MLDYLQEPTKHEIFFKKYASKKFLKASLFVKEWIAQKTEAFKETEELPSL